MNYKSRLILLGLFLVVIGIMGVGTFDAMQKVTDHKIQQNKSVDIDAYLEQVARQPLR